MEGSDGSTYSKVSEKIITEWRESTDKCMEVGKGQPMMLDVEKAGQSRRVTVGARNCMRN